MLRRFGDFLDADNGHGAYSTRIANMVKISDTPMLDDFKGPKRLIVNVDDLRQHDKHLADDLLHRPVEFLPALERAMQDLIVGIEQRFQNDQRRLADYRVGLDGAFGSRLVSPRGLTARLVGGVVCVEGIVTRASTIRPRLVVSVHYCPRTGKFHEKTYRDNASVSSLASFTQNAGMPGSSYPTKDEDGNPLETEFGKCWYRDSQRITIQEMPEKSPPGQLPRSVDVLIEGDLCDACKPGDRVRISGIFRAIGGSVSAGGNGIFKTFVVSNHITLLGGAEGRANVDNTVSDGDIHNIIEYSQKGDVFERMSRSIAPSICGHEYIKKALLLLLIGGKEQNLANGTHLRGDINVMMVGDPSTAKSQLLRFILNTAPLAVSTTGRGSSGVGLTAAVTTDQDTGDRHLEAGAMVLADRGVVCIDEFDKMSDEDRVAIHEVMEQQTVTIAKAGIHASLNARCSVIAAANPVYGSYDKSRKPHENIALPDSLLSRFDLLFIVLDSSDKQRDRMIADHVLRGHRYRKPTHTLDELGDTAADAARARAAGRSAGDDGGSKETPMYEDAASALYRAQREGSSRRRSSRRAKKTDGDDSDRILSMDFVKLYINYAKHRANPTLTPAAAEHIASAYRDLRQDLLSTKTLPITARCLETLIRLATAHAKCRLDKIEVTEADAEVAVTVLKFALFNQAEPDKSEKVFKRRTRKGSKTKDDENDDDSDDDDEAKDPSVKQTPSRRATRSSRSSDKPESAQADAFPESMEAEGPDAEEDEITPSTPNQKTKTASTPRSSMSTRSTRSSVKNRTPHTESSQKEKAAISSLLDSNSISDEATQPQSSGDKANIIKLTKSALNELRGREDVIPIPSILQWLGNPDNVEVPLTEEQARVGLEALVSEDIIVVSDDTVFIV